MKNSQNGHLREFINWPKSSTSLIYKPKNNFYAHIQSLINYASTIWDGASESALKPINRTYRRALKLLLLKSNSISTQDYKNLNILSLESKLEHKKGLLMRKIMTGKAPAKLIDKFPINPNRHVHKIVTEFPRIKLYKSSLQYSGGTLWNSLPRYLKEAKSQRVFKRKYNEYLLQKS